jgi:hypothetical protein
VSFLQKAKDKAGEVAREAADASTRAAGAVSARAHDPEAQEKLKAGLTAAGKTAADASAKAADASAKAATAVVAKAQDPATQAKVKDGLATAGRGARTMVERIDPGILADIVIKATGLQERANARLRMKGSMYRIGEIQVTASLPPGISFSIERSAMPRQIDPRHPLLSSTGCSPGRPRASSQPPAPTPSRRSSRSTARSRRRSPSRSPTPRRPWTPRSGSSRTRPPTCRRAEGGRTRRPTA